MISYWGCYKEGQRPTPLPKNLTIYSHTDLAPSDFVTAIIVILWRYILRCCVLTTLPRQPMTVVTTDLKIFNGVAINRSMVVIQYNNRRRLYCVYCGSDVTDVVVRWRSGRRDVAVVFDRFLYITGVKSIDQRSINACLLLGLYVSFQSAYTPTELPFEPITLSGLANRSFPSENVVSPVPICLGFAENCIAPVRI